MSVWRSPSKRVASSHVFGGTTKDNNPEVRLVESLPALRPRFKSDEQRQATFDGIVYQSKRRYAVPRSKIEENVKEILGQVLGSAFRALALHSSASPRLFVGRHFVIAA